MDRRFSLHAAFRQAVVVAPGWVFRLVFFMVPAGLLLALSAVNCEAYTWPVRESIRSSRDGLLTFTGQGFQVRTFYPVMLMLALSAAFRLLLRRPGNRLRLPVGVMFLVLELGYLTFRVCLTLSFDSWSDGVFSILFLLSEVLIHLRMALSSSSLLELMNRSAEADDSQRAVRAGEFVPSVDILVSARSEPIEILRRAIIGCQAIDYRCKTIYLLDQQRRPAIRQLAEELACCYLEAPDNPHANEDNLHRVKGPVGELIAGFEAGFVPGRGFLERTVGFFRDLKMAMLRTNFLGAGSGFLIRRSALEKIGRPPTDTITKHRTTSLRLAEAGYQTQSLNESLSAGMSRDNFREFVEQRVASAEGILKGLVGRTGGASIPGVNWKQRLSHFSGIIYYLGSFATVFVLIAPLFFLFFGIHFLRMSMAEMIFFRLPLILGFYLIYTWLTCGTWAAVRAELYEAFLAPSTALSAMRNLSKRFGARSGGGEKSNRQQRDPLNRRVAIPFIVLLSCYLFGIGFALHDQRHRSEPDAFGIATYFAVCNISILSICISLGRGLAQHEPYVRFARQLLCVVTWGPTGIVAETVFLSEGDVVLKTGRPIEQIPEKAFFHVPEIGLSDLPIRFKKVDAAGQFTFQFEDVTLAQSRRLIEYLVSQPRRAVSNQPQASPS